MSAKAWQDLSKEFESNKDIVSIITEGTDSIRVVFSDLDAMSKFVSRHKIIKQYSNNEHSYKKGQHIEI